MKKLIIIAGMLTMALFAMADAYTNIINSLVYSPELEKLAEEGDVRAQNQLGVMYQQGSGIEQDIQKAVYWYAKAAEAGNPNAMVNIGAIYLKGNGVEPDMETAVMWFEKAAAEDNQAALYNLARLYLAGAGVTKDQAKGFEYAKKAADQSLKSSVFDDKEANRKTETGVTGDALILVAGCYHEGIGTTPNPKLAIEYLERAAKIGNIKACLGLAECYETGDGVEPDPEKAQKYRNMAESLKNK